MNASTEDRPPATDAPGPDGTRRAASGGRIDVAAQPGPAQRRGPLGGAEAGPGPVAERSWIGLVAVLILVVAAVAVIGSLLLPGSS